MEKIRIYGKVGKVIGVLKKGITMIVPLIDLHGKDLRTIGPYQKESNQFSGLH